MIKCEERLPTTSGFYALTFSYSDKGDIKFIDIESYYDELLKMFEIEGDNFPQGMVINWKEIPYRKLL